MINLRKFSTTVIKDKSTTDQAQIPATVDIDVYKRGASVSAATIISAGGGTGTVSIYDLGSIEVGSTLKVGTDTGSNLTVTALGAVTVTGTITSITVRNDHPSNDVALTLYSRLVVTGPTRPTLYRESTATAILDASGHTTTDARGYAEFYLAEEFFDYIATSGSNTALFTDQQSGAANPFVDVRDFDTFQDAIDALPDTGGTVWVPAGYYDRTTRPQVVPMTITKPIRLTGDTPSTHTAGSYIKYQFANGSPEDLTSDLLTISGDNASWSIVENLLLIGAGSPGSGRGIVLEGPVNHLTIHNVKALIFPSHAFATGDGGDIVFCHLQDCQFNGSESNCQASIGEGTSGVFHCQFVNCDFDVNGVATQGVRLKKGFGITFRDCTFEGSYDPASANGDTGCYLYVQQQGEGSIRLIDCWFENNAVTVTPNNWFIYFDGTSANITSAGAIISGCFFARAHNGATSLRAIKSVSTIASAGLKDAWIANNLGNLLGQVGVGTDDIVIGASDQGVILHNNFYQDNNRYNNAFTVSGTTPAIRGRGPWILTASGKPVAAGGPYEIGDHAYNTNDHRLYICEVAGSPGTWSYWDRTGVL